MTETMHHRLSEPERKAYACQIKKAISDFTLTYTWLIRQLSEEGMLTDKFEMSATLAGSRRGTKADEILCLSLDILSRYQERLNSCDGS